MRCSPLRVQKARSIDGTDDTVHGEDEVRWQPANRWQLHGIEVLTTLRTESTFH